MAVIVDVVPTVSEGESANAQRTLHVSDIFFYSVARQNESKSLSPMLTQWLLMILLENVHPTCSS